MKLPHKPFIYVITMLIVMLCWVNQAAGTENKPLRVGVIGTSPPMSYLDESGRLTGLNIDLARALCEAIKARCELVQVPLLSVVELLADNELDFAAVSLLITPERQKKVLFTKPYYRSLTFWVGKSNTQPGDAGQIVGVVAGSAQARYSASSGWKMFQVNTHNELVEAVVTGRATGLLVPMLTAVPLMKDSAIERLELTATTITAPSLSSNTAFSVNPRHAELRDKLDAAMDQLKRNGRFDRITSDYLPFKLQ